MFISIRFFLSCNFYCHNCRLFYSYHHRCPYKDANGYDQKYVVILNENDPIFSTTRHLHIKKAREWIVANVKTFTEQSKALVCRSKDKLIIIFSLL